MRRVVCLLALAGLGSAALPIPAAAQRPGRTAEAERVLSALVERYGVSGAEGPVRDAVRTLLPSWARPETDSAGNLWVRAGQGDPLVVFVAHLDEIGFHVSAIRDDGTLAIAPRGGFFPSLFEARPALVHTAGGVVPGVFTPRDSATGTRSPGGFRVDVGVTSRAAAASLGIKPGDTVTGVKRYRRLAGTRVTGRSLDDRVGCAALLLALRRLDPARLRHEVVFLFSVREEIGLEGARAAADALGLRPARVHPVDTFVSAETPVDPQAYAVAPLGGGAIARALDNSSVTPPALVDSLAALARARGIPFQRGTTGGGNDGSAFAPFGVPDVPLGWPLRYSHSPAELADLRDVVALADLVQAVAEDW
ncbi:MAG TPA: M20/M25/M40 family metallo-hydrolase [Gemmatimonadales bacterium]|jgi:putative aminopeptidase FrvX|nr:M20/M25/M40 family metallo-hydrolase [Gemmatimonadales bacterium]